jgi:predicted HTH domain antitoxin
VFNAEQIDGLPPLAVKAPDWDRHQRAEALLRACGVEIRHDQAERAFYRPATDKIHLPPRDGFQSADNFYSTALHELGHASGHPSRLDRDLAHPFGSVGYAKEELRAEIASLMIGDELGIGHDPGQHAAYVNSWVQILKEEPKEILRAARDADKIAGYVMDLEKERGGGGHRKAPADRAPVGAAGGPQSARRGVAIPQTTDQFEPRALRGSCLLGMEYNGSAVALPDTREPCRPCGWSQRMSRLILAVPDESLLSLKLSDEAAAAQIRLAASVKLYELGRLSCGAAARLAGVARVLFLSKLADSGAGTFPLSDDELEHQTSLV